MSFLLEKMNLNEMAKRAQDRITSRLSKERKLIFLVCKYVEKNEGASNSAFTLPIWQHIATRMAGVTWDEFCQVFEIPESDRSNASRITDIVKKKCTEKYARLYNHMKRTIEVNSDEIDKKYINPAEKCFVELTAGVAPDVAYEENNMEVVLDWLVNNPDEAKDRIGEAQYRKFLNRFIVWLDPERYHNTIQEVKDQFKQYINALKNDRNLKIDKTLLYKLALIIKSGDAATLLGEANVADTVAKVVKSSFGGESNIPSVGLCKSFLHLKLDGNKFVECSDDEISEDDFSDAEKVQLAIDRLPGALTLIPEDDIKTKIADICKELLNAAKSGGNVSSDYFNMDHFGSITAEDKPLIKRVFLKCVNKYNPDYAVGFKAPFMEAGDTPKEKITNFYKKYLPIFKLQITEERLMSLFEQIAKAYKEKFEEEKRSYYQNVNDEGLDDFQEAVRLVRRHGYIVD